MSLDDQRGKAFDFCSDATKQLITLSAGIVAFMVTFAKDFVSTVAPAAKTYAYLAWVGYGLSIVFGILVLLALTAQLEPKDASSSEPPSIRGAAASYSFLQIAAFVVAVGFTIIFGVKAGQSAPQHDAALAKVTEPAGTVQSLPAELAKVQRSMEALQREERSNHTYLRAELRRLRARMGPARR